MVRVAGGLPGPRTAKRPTHGEGPRVTPGVSPSIVVFDGSLAGLLSVVFDAFAVGLRVDRLEREARHAPAMFAEPVRVATDPAHARRVWAGLEKFADFDRELVLRCWLFDTTEADTDVAHLLVRMFRDGAWAAEDYRDEAVFRCRQVHKKMFREIHRVHAFVRFAEAEDGLYFARIDPDFDVLPLAVDHFERRYQDQEWMIWDGRRDYGFWYRPGSPRSVLVGRPGAGHTTDLEGGTAAAALEVGPADDAPAQASGEDAYRKLWRTYFDSVNIAERANPRLHRAHVPERYWRHLTEKRPENEGALPEDRRRRRSFDESDR